MRSLKFRPIEKIFTRESFSRSFYFPTPFLRLPFFLEFMYSYQNINFDFLLHLLL